MKKVNKKKEEIFLSLFLVGSSKTERNNVSQKLRMLGHTVELSASGMEAFAKLEKTKKLHAVILDNDLGDMSPLEFLTLARDRYEKKKLPIIVMTNEFNEDDYNDVEKLEGEYVEKTASLVELSQKLEEVKSNISET